MFVKIKGLEMSNIETQQVKKIKSAPGAETEKPRSWLAWVSPVGALPPSSDVSMRPYSSRS